MLLLIKTKLQKITKIIQMITLHIKKKSYAGLEEFLFHAGTEVSEASPE